jgi:L,D-peptidoglycan transpeptidase YkuD (ErfK/YbiS/YcfS/YnhG family)
MGWLAVAAAVALGAPQSAVACEPIPAPAAASQLITVDARSYTTTSAALRLWRRSGRCWVRVAGPWRARVGRNGLSNHHLEGDGTTPTGAYPLGRVIYGIGADPGVRYAYHRLVCGDWWNGDPSSAGYNTFQHVSCGAQPPFAGGSEPLWKLTTAYRHFAVIRYNASPVVAGRGSAIFLHADTGAPTNGCVSLPLGRLTRVLRWLRPDRAPHIVIGTKS